MGEVTNIAWTDSSWSPWWGCTRISPACGQGGMGGCYAEAFSKRVGHGKRLPLIWGPRAARRFFGADHWRKPLRWNRLAARAGVRRRVFCASMADVFEKVAGPVGDRMDAERASLWTLIEATPWLDWQVLTKRPENFASMLPARWARKMPINLWLGVTVESRLYIPRIHHLLRTLAAITFVSAEPLLEDISAGLRGYLGTRPLETSEGVWVTGDAVWVPNLAGTRWPAVDQVIVGGESGPRSRPFDIDWARKLRDVCRARETSFFCKQFGANPIDSARPGERIALRSRAGSDPAEWSEDLRIQEFPRSKEPIAA